MLQLLSQPSIGNAHLSLDGIHRYAQLLGDVGMPHALQFAHYENLSALFGQTRDGFFESTINVFFVVKVGFGLQQGIKSQLHLLSINILKQGCGSGLHQLVAQIVETSVPNARKQVANDMKISINCPRMLVQLDEDILHNVFGVVFRLDVSCGKSFRTGIPSNI